MRFLPRDKVAAHNGVCLKGRDCASLRYGGSFYRAGGARGGGNGINKR